MPLLHIILESPALYEVTKTELDIGAITKSYVDIAHCIRAGFCVSHALRKWVRISIGFTQLGPLTMTLDPNTIRYLGTDERSILHVILRGQEAFRKPRTKIPHGVTLSDKLALEVLSNETRDGVKLLAPGDTSTWQKLVTSVDKLVMYCPLSKEWKQEDFAPYKPDFYSKHLHRDLAILEVVHAIDSAEIGLQKD